MNRQGQEAGSDPTNNSPHIVVSDGGGEDSSEIVSILESQGYRIHRDRVSETPSPLSRGERPALAIWVAGVGMPAARLAGLHASAHELGIPSLDVLDAAPDPSSWADPREAPDDWVGRGCLRAELPARVARLLLYQGQPGSRPQLPRRPSKPIDERFVSLVVHDLRTPLNVIGLSLRMIGQAIPRGDPDLEENLLFVEENFKQIERMLTQLSDYSRLFHVTDQGMVYEFSPRQVLDDLLHDLATRAGSKPLELSCDVEESCPREATLDPARARVALKYAIENAAASAKDKPVHVKMRGGSDRWVIEVGLDVPPPPSVKPTELRTDTFERICGTAAERRGIDLAIAARVSELFGGTARLDVDENRGTAVILEWPVRLEDARREGPGVAPPVR